MNAKSFKLFSSENRLNGLSSVRRNTRVDTDEAVAYSPANRTCGQIHFCGFFFFFARLLLNSNVIITFGY